MEYYARKDENGRKQLLKDHIDGVARRSIRNGTGDFKNILELTALLHDKGKYSAAWQDYMLNSLNKKVPHSLDGMGTIRSHPSRVHGLKHTLFSITPPSDCRTLYGCVD